MKKRSSTPARVLAAIAVIGGFILVIVIVSTSLGGSDSSKKTSTEATHHHHVKSKPAPATYVIKEGDTLIAIAHQTGIPVVKIERLNPGIDPQILTPGETLKLR